MSVHKRILRIGSVSAPDDLSAQVLANTYKSVSEVFCHKRSRATMCLIGFE